MPGDHEECTESVTGLAQSGGENNNGMQDRREHQNQLSHQRPGFGEVLVQLRVDAGLTQERLAEISRVSARTISDLERGIVKVPHGDTVLRLARGLQLEGPVKVSFERFSRRMRSQVEPSASSLALRTLPRDISSFTGRDSELRRLAERVCTGGVVGIYAIDGMAGVGKTAFAVHAAHTISMWFPDGQLFFSLHGHTPGQQPVSPADALASLLVMIGVSANQVPQGIDDRVRLWRDRLADRRLLLVLDDAANSDQVRPLLPSNAESLVLITSRQMMAALDDIRTISLDSLSAADAATLLVTLADRPDIHPHDAAVAQIVEQCGNLPLAIGMAASRLRFHPAWTPSDLVDELVSARDAGHLLDEANLAVAAAFELSYRDLNPSEGMLFRRLGRFPGVEIDAFAAAALDGTDLRSARRHLDGVYNRHLINEPARGRYRFHDLIRLYASNLDPGDEGTDAEAMRRVLDYYLHVAQVAGQQVMQSSAPRTPVEVAAPPRFAPDISTPQQALAWMTLELPNLSAMVRYAAAHGQHQHAIAIPAAMKAFMRSRVHWHHAVVLHQAAVSAAEACGDQAAKVSALNDLGDFQRAAGDYAAATTSLTRAMTLSGEICDSAGQATAAYGLGAIAYLTGSYETATAMFAESMEMFRSQGDQLGEARSLDAFGTLQHATGDFAAATASLTKALDLYRQAGYPSGEASTLNHLGIVQQSTADYAAAAASQQQAVELNRRVSDRLGEANALNNLAAAQLALEDLAGAQASVTAALELYANLGVEHGEANALNHLGSIQLADKQFAAAEASQRRAIDLYLKHGDHFGEAAALSELGSVQYERRNYPQAVEYLKAALRLYEEHGDRAGQAETLNKLGETLQVSDEATRAREQFERAHDIAANIDLPVELARALEGKGRCDLRAERYEDALANLSQALDIYERISSPRARRVRATVRHLR